jgi:hypothetical protein
MSITLTLEGIRYSLAMTYRISTNKKAVTLICLACTHKERVQDFEGHPGNQRTLAAHAMLNTSTPSTAVKLTSAQRR